MQTEIGYLSPPSRITGSWRELGTKMYGVYGPPASGYDLVPAILVPNYGFNSTTALWKAWESQRLRKKIQKKNLREENSDTTLEIMVS